MGDTGDSSEGWSKSRGARKAGGAVGKGILQGAGRKIGATIVGLLIVSGGVYGISQSDDDDDRDDRPATTQQQGDDD